MPSLRVRVRAISSYIFREMLDSFGGGGCVILQTASSFSLIFCTVSEFESMPKINSSISMASHLVLIALSK